MCDFKMSLSRTVYLVRFPTGQASRCLDKEWYIVGYIILICPLSFDLLSVFSLRERDSYSEKIHFTDDVRSLDPNARETLGQWWPIVLDPNIYATVSH